MSFRNRLGLFFVLIVIVPMVAVAVLLFGLLGKSEQSMGEADVGARQQTARSVYADARSKADRLLTVVGKDKVFGDAIQAGDISVPTSAHGSCSPRAASSGSCSSRATSSR